MRGETNITSVVMGGVQNDIDALKEVSTSGSYFRRQGDIVIMNVYSWTKASELTIPTGYRPRDIVVYSVCEQKAGSSGTPNYGRISINRNGTFNLSSNNDHFIAIVAYIGE